ncbi:phage integrase N-terminal SAM-like domain-containing protein [Candidatus Bathyarchaeota archaeon]|nr:phage integrase N-terminal SAM-like domain-containing protein [Candidatus Bathyarchaeota archaeon]
MVENLEVYPTVQKWLTKLQTKSRSFDFNKSSTRRAGLYWLKRYCNFVKSNPETIIRERTDQLQSKDINTKRTQEEVVESFIIYLKNQNNAPNTVSTAIGLVRSFYKSNYVGLVELSPIRPYTVRPFKIPTIKDIKKMCAVADAETKAWILAQFNSGLGNIDLIDLSLTNLSSEYGTIGQQLRKGTVPIHVELRRQKTGERVNSFFGPNAIEALKEYVNVNGRTSKIFNMQMRTIQQRVKALGIKAKISTQEVPVTPYVFRKAFNSYLKFGDPSKDIPGVNEALVEMMMGHSIGRVRSAYLVTGQGSTGTGIPISKLAEIYMKTYPVIDITLI